MSTPNNNLSNKIHIYEEDMYHNTPIKKIENEKINKDTKYHYTNFIYEEDMYNNSIIKNTNLKK
jgi:hypothetical protein